MTTESIEQLRDLERRLHAKEQEIEKLKFALYEFKNGCDHVNENGSSAIATGSWAGTYCRICKRSPKEKEEGRNEKAIRETDN